MCVRSGVPWASQIKKGGGGSLFFLPGSWVSMNVTALCELILSGTLGGTWTTSRYIPYPLHKPPLPNHNTTSAMGVLIRVVKNNRRKRAVAQRRKICVPDAVYSPECFRLGNHWLLNLLAALLLLPARARKRVEYGATNISQRGQKEAAHRQGGGLGKEQRGCAHTSVVCRKHSLAAARGV